MTHVMYNRRGKYLKWEDSEIIKVWIDMPGSGTLTIDGRVVSSNASAKLPGRLEVKRLFVHGVLVVRACIPTAIPQLYITDDFGQMIRPNYDQFAFSIRGGHYE